MKFSTWEPQSRFFGGFVLDKPTRLVFLAEQLALSTEATTKGSSSALEGWGRGGELGAGGYYANDTQERLRAGCEWGALGTENERGS